MKQVFMSKYGDHVHRAVTYRSHVTLDGTWVVTCEKPFSFCFTDETLEGAREKAEEGIDFYFATASGTV